MRHHCGFDAITFPLQSGNPQAASVSFTARGEGEEARADGLRVRLVGVEDDPVVLVGAERLLEPALRAERDPAERDRGQVEARPSVSSITRTVSRSFSVEMKWVSVSAWTPWARSAR